MALGGGPPPFGGGTPKKKKKHTPLFFSEEKKQKQPEGAFGQAGGENFLDNPYYIKIFFSLSKKNRWPKFILTNFFQFKKTQNPLF